MGAETDVVTFAAELATVGPPAICMSPALNDTNEHVYTSKIEGARTISLTHCQMNMRGQAETSAPLEHQAARDSQ